jgi:hypothetical protein
MRAGHPRPRTLHANGPGWAAWLLGLAILAFLALLPDGAHAATVTCGNPADTAQLVDLSTLSRAPGDDLQVVGNCLVPGGLMSNPSPDYKFGKVNIYSQNPGSCTLDSKLAGNTAKPCGGTLTFKDERIDFWASSIIVERGGSLIAGSPAAPIGTTGRGEEETGRHVLTITLWGPGSSLARDVPGVGCISTNCGVPSDTWTGGASAPKPLPGVANPDYFYAYDRLPFDSSGYFGNKVLGVAFGGRLLLYGKKGATYATVPGPLDSGTSWRRLAGNLAVGNTTVMLDRKVDWEKGDSVVVTGTDYLPRHFEQRTIAAVALDGLSFTASSGMAFPHVGKRFPLTRVPGGTNGLGIDPVMLANGAEVRAAVALLSRSIVIRSGGDTIGSLLCEDVGCYYGGHTVIRQGVLAATIQGVEFAQLGQGGRLGRYPVHFHMLRHAPPGTALLDSSINESMTRWVTLHATQDVTLARNVGFESIGHGFYLEDGTETDNKLYSNLGIFARAAVVGWPDGQLKAKNDANWRKVPGILAQRLQITANGIDPPQDPNDGTQADLFPFHSDWNHPSVFWVMNAWNDFQGNMATGAGMCGACYWMVPGTTSGHSRMMQWVGYASRQKQDSMNNYPEFSRAGSSPLQNFSGNSCSSAEFSFITISRTEPCRGFGDVNAGRVAPVDNPLAPDTCWVQGTDSPFPSPAQCVKAQPNPNPPVEGDPAFVPTNDYGYYPIVDGVGGRFPIQCKDPTKDCSLSAAGQRRCTNISKTVVVNGVSTVVAGGDVDPECTVDVLDHYTSQFNWAPHNFAAILLRPFWYLVNHSVIGDVQNGGISIITGGDYSRSSAINGYWSLVERSVLIGQTEPGNAFADAAGPFNAASGLKCDAQATDFCLLRDQQWTINFADWAVNQRLFNIYDGPSYQTRNAYLDVKPSVIDSPAKNCNGNLDCLRLYYPIAFGPVNGIMRSPTGTGAASHSCFLPNAAIAWKQSNGFYYPPAFHSSKLFFDNVDIRHFVVEPLFDATKNGYQTDETKTNATYCKPPALSNVFNTFSDIDRQTVLNDVDGSLTGLVHTLSVNKISPFFTAPFETDECAAQTGVTNLSPAPPAPQATAKTSPYDYVTTVLLPGCSQEVKPPGQEQAICGCNAGGDQCTEWARVCTDGSCSGARLWRQLTTSQSETAPYIRMAGQSSWQRSTLTANNGTYYIDSTYTKAQQLADGFADPTAGGKLSLFQAGRDYYLFLVYATGTTKQDYKVFVGGTDVKKGTATGCTAGGTMPAPYLIRADVSGAPSKISPAPGQPPKYPMPWKYCYNETGHEPGVLTVHVDMTPFAAELAPKPVPAYNSICQPKTFCAVNASKGTCGCAAKNPMSNDPASKADCDEICGTWAVKDIDCPSGGCIGFGFKLPTPFTIPATNPRPAPTGFPKDSHWNLYAGAGFQKMAGAAGSGMPGAQCTYTQSFTGHFWQ